jgi:hypothetical protein
MNLILNRAGFRTNHEPNMVHGMVHGIFQKLVLFGIWLPAAGPEPSWLRAGRDFDI